MINIRKLLISVLSGMLCVLTFCGCSSRNAPSVLVHGRWSTGNSYYEFYENGRYYYVVSWDNMIMHTESGDWTISGNIITKDPDDPDLVKVKFLLSESEKTLVTCYEDSKNYTYYWIAH